jgi:hypothetical protein
MGMKNYETFKLSGRVRIITLDSKTGKWKRATSWFKNLVVAGTNTGRNLIAQRLASANTYSLNITHADIGTGTNAPSNSDTQLQTPSTRALVSNQIISGNVVTLQFFFPDALLPNGTYNEFGTFVDGSTGLSTGKIFNRALFGTPYVKNSGEDTTIEVSFTIN